MSKFFQPNRGKLCFFCLLIFLALGASLQGGTSFDSAALPWSGLMKNLPLWPLWLLVLLPLILIFGIVNRFANSVGIDLSNGWWLAQVVYYYFLACLTDQIINLLRARCFPG